MNNATWQNYELRTVPYTLIDAINRVAAASGSSAYANATAYADYNGHHVAVSWNEYRGHWVAQYWWARRVVLYQGTDLRAAIDAASREHRRGVKGTSVTVCPRTEDEAAICHEMGLTPVPECAEPPNWMDPRCAEVGTALRHEQMGIPATRILLESATAEEFREKLGAALQIATRQRVPHK